MALKTLILKTPADVDQFIAAQEKEPATLIQRLYVPEQRKEAEYVIGNFHELRLEVDDAVADYLIEAMLKHPLKNITTLALPNIKLSAKSWDIFFSQILTLWGFTDLRVLDLQNSNFDYHEQLDSLGQYLSLDNVLRSINLCHDNKKGAKDFQAGNIANKLHHYLQNNTHLLSLKYGHLLDDLLAPNISPEMSKILRINMIRSLAHIMSEESYDELLKESKNAEYIKTFDDQVLFRIHTLQLLGKEQKLSKDELASKDLEIFTSLTGLNVGAAYFKENPKTTEKDQKDVEHLNTLLQFYSANFYLIHIIESLYQQELKASPHDQPILSHLRQELLEKWEKAMANQADKGQAMADLMDSMQISCQKSAEQLENKTLIPLLKNILLVISGILTLGVSLGIYAIVNRQSIADNNSFFFKANNETKEGLDEVSSDLGKIKGG